MTEIRRDIQHHSSIQLSDILFALFKRKWTIIVCALLGIIAAAAVYHFYPAAYQSQAKLLVRYVLERSAVDSIDNTTRPNQASGGTKTTDTVIDSEVQILTSWDLAAEVASAIGPNRLGAPTKEAAAGGIVSGIQVTSSKGSDVILVSYENRDPQLTTLVLQELLNRYFVKHLEVHRSAGAFDFVTQQTDQVRMQLNQTEDALKPLNELVGIISLAEGRTALGTDLVRTEAQLHAAEAEFAEQQARVKELGESPLAASVPAKGGVTKQKSRSAPQTAGARQSPVANQDDALPS